ncbi:MAG: FecR domain-containing protein [Candidatus Rifleibacteriota bacterium]
MKFVKIVLIMCSIFFYGCSDQNNVPIGQLIKISGTVEIREAPGQKFKTASVNLKLFNDMAVRTQENSKAKLSFTCGGQLKLSSNAFFQVKSGQVLGKQTSGSGFYEIDKQPKPLSIETPHGVTTILGTKFRQMVNETSVEIFLKEGSIEFYDNAGNKTKIESGQKLLVEKGKPLTEAVPTDDFDVDKLFNEDKSLKNF